MQNTTVRRLKERKSDHVSSVDQAMCAVWQRWIMKKYEESKHALPSLPRHPES